MKSVISDNKIIPFLPCYKRTSQLHETKVSDLKTVYGCNGYAVYDYIENEIFRTGNHSLYWCKNMILGIQLSIEQVNLNTILHDFLHFFRRECPIVRYSAKHILPPRFMNI